MRLGLWRCLLAVIVLFADAGCIFVSASRGDRGHSFSDCRGACVNSTCPQAESFEAKEFAMGVDEAQELAVTWLGWSCPENCEYVCMHRMNGYRMRQRRPVLKYYGKWPFYRVLGIQEIASTVFSVGNFLTNLFFFFKFNSKQVSDAYPFKHVLLLMTVIGMNTWVWSTAFHARDVYWTERADYYGAIGNVFSVLAVAIVVSRRWVNKRVQAWTGASVLGLACLHITYMQLVHFDYGFNMFVLAVCTAQQAALWLVWAWQLEPGPETSYRWKMVLFQLLMIPAGFLELFDFPPVWGYFDAHSLWHGSSIPLYVLYYSFFISDAARYERLFPDKTI
jgi:hypothetical protein